MITNKAFSSVFRFQVTQISAEERQYSFLNRVSTRVEPDIRTTGYPAPEYWDFRNSGSVPFRKICHRKFRPEFRILGLTRNPEFQSEFPVTNSPEQNRTRIPENSIFWRRISGCQDIRLKPTLVTWNSTSGGEQILRY